MRRAWRQAWFTASAAVFLALLLPAAARAHDCSSVPDCLQTAGFNALIALIGGIIALVAGMLGNTLTGVAAEGGQIGPEMGPPPAMQTETVVVSGPDAVRELVRAGYPVVRDAAGNPVRDANGNPLVLVPTNWGGGFQGGGYGTRTVRDPVTGRDVQVLDPNNVAVVQEVQRPAVDHLPQEVYSGSRALDVLEQSGLVVRERGREGNFVYRPTREFNTLDSSGTTVRTGEVLDAARQPVQVQESKIPRVNGVGWRTLPDGSIDPTSVAVAVSQGPPGDAMGRPGQWDSYARPLPGVEVQGDPAFVARVQNDLNTMMRTASGLVTLNGIANSGHTVVIKQNHPDPGNVAMPHHPWDGRADPDTGNRRPGTDVTIGYDPTRLALDANTQPWHARPPDVALHHELVHALHGATGQMANGTVRDPRTGRWIPRAEAQATGIGPYSGINPAQPTDNSYRLERGVTQRPSYNS